MMQKLVEMIEIQNLDSFKIKAKDFDVEAAVCGNYIRNAVKELRAEKKLPEMAAIMTRLSKGGIPRKSEWEKLDRYQLTPEDAEQFLCSVS